jgi:hypothetical protein
MRFGLWLPSRQAVPPHTSIILTAGIGMAVAQTVIVADSNHIASLRNSSYRSAMHKQGSRCIFARGECLGVPWQSRRAITVGNRWNAEWHTPLKRSDSCSSGLIVKSPSFPT